MWCGECSQWVFVWSGERSRAEKGGPLLWPGKKMCWDVWEDVDLSALRWGERMWDGAGTDFKTRLFVLVQTHGDSSTTGDLSWTQPSSQTPQLSLSTPSPLLQPGPQGLVPCVGCPVHAGLVGAMHFLFQRASSDSVYASFQTCPFVPRKQTAEVLLGCQEKEGSCLFCCFAPSLHASLSAVPE